MTVSGSINRVMSRLKGWLPTREPSEPPLPEGYEHVEGASIRSVMSPEEFDDDPSIRLYCLDCEETFEGYFGWYSHALDGGHGYETLSEAEARMRVIIEAGEEPLSPRLRDGGEDAG